ASGWFERFSCGGLFGIGALVSATGFMILYWLSGTLHGFPRARSLQRLTMGQALRFYGVLALVMWHHNVLPALFAIPTGLMDIAFAVTSFYAATRLLTPDREITRGFVIWHVLGVVALGISVTLAMLTSSERFGLVSGGVTSQSMTRFPMSLVPTFVGPFVWILHQLVLAAILLQRREKMRLTRISERASQAH
ncbi:MAG TPA: hypothetical protein VNH18_15425, partial [Bryobacteraceae bacterium]|nr:hypothetical protein [Bryobacteraceae bacterium]